MTRGGRRTGAYRHLNRRVAAVVVAVAVGGCGGSHRPGVCVGGEGELLELNQWYGTRVDSIGGPGTSCSEPVVIVGEYQRCSEEHCVIDAGQGVSRIPYPVLWVERHWIQINHFYEDYFGAANIDCGDFVGHELVFGWRGEPLQRMVFDTRRFVEVQDLRGGSD